MTDRVAPSYDFYTTPRPGAAPPAPAPLPPVPVAGPDPTAAPASAAPAAPVFGGPAVNQFGTPLTVAGASLPLAGPVPSPPVPARSVVDRVAAAPTWVWRLALPVAGALVLGMFGVGKLGFLDVVHRAPVAPATLAGLPRADDARTDRLRSMLDSWGAAESDYAVQWYEDATGASAMLVELSGELSTAELHAAMDADSAPAGAVPVGTATCSEHPVMSMTVAVCGRVDDGRTVLVMRSPGDTGSASVALTEAWNR